MSTLTHMRAILGIFENTTGDGDFAAALTEYMGRIPNPSDRNNVADCLDFIAKQTHLFACHHPAPSIVHNRNEKRETCGACGKTRIWWTHIEEDGSFGGHVTTHYGSWETPR
jgi:hypothetical protein